jgi:hypothetical protein
MEGSRSFGRWAFRTLRSRTPEGRTRRRSIERGSVNRHTAVLSFRAKRATESLRHQRVCVILPLPHGHPQRLKLGIAQLAPRRSRRIRWPPNSSPPRYRPHTHLALSHPEDELAESSRKLFRVDRTRPRAFPHNTSPANRSSGASSLKSPRGSDPRPETEHLIEGLDRRHSATARKSIAEWARAGRRRHRHWLWLHRHRLAKEPCRFDLCVDVSLPFCGRTTQCRASPLCRSQIQFLESNLRAACYRRIAARRVSARQPTKARSPRVAGR